MRYFEVIFGHTAALVLVWILPVKQRVTLPVRHLTNLFPHE